MKHKILILSFFIITILSVGNFTNAKPYSNHYADYTSNSANFVLVQLVLIKDGVEVPIEDVSVELNGYDYHPKSNIGELEIGNQTFSLTYDNVTISKKFHFKPIMMQKDYPDYIKFLNSNEYELTNIIRITFNFDTPENYI